MKNIMNMSAVAVLGVLFFVGCASNRIEEKLGPAESIDHFSKSISESNGFQVWASFPKSWRADINGLAHLIGEKMPEKSWDDISVLVGKVGALMETKADLFYRTAKEMGPLPPGISEKDAITSIKDLGKVLTILANSRISTLNSVKTVDLGDVAEDSVSRIFELISTNNLVNQVISKESRGEVTSLKNIFPKCQVKLISEIGDKADVSIVELGGREDEVRMIKIEDKWLPEELVDEYNKEMPKLKKMLSQQLDEAAKNELMFSTCIAVISVITSSIEDAETVDDIKAVFTNLQKFQRM